MFLIAVSLGITAILFFCLERTCLGARIRASVDSPRVAQGLGLDVERIFAITFALGSGLAGLGGALAIEIVGLDPSFGFHFLVYVLIIVAVGGLGSVAGSFAGAALLGIGEMFAGAVLLEAEPAVVSRYPRVREVYLGTKHHA